ncbi:MAG TPA: hypothetical protein VG448_13885 [Solirubrobacterales bacterium]|nr:hypothetical protein [Solirubrobacterales bacterium]
MARRRRGGLSFSPRVLVVGVTALVIAALLAVGLSTGGGSSGSGETSRGGGHPKPHISQAVPVR